MMMRIVKVSAALTIFAHSLIFPTTPSLTHMNSECRISAFLLNVYFVLNNQLWSLRNPSLERWLWWVAQVPTSPVFYSKHWLSHTDLGLLIMETWHGMLWVLLILVTLMFSYLSLNNPLWSPTHLNIEYWLWLVFKVPTPLVFYPSHWLFPTDFLVHLI